MGLLRNQHIATFIVGGRRTMIKLYVGVVFLG